MVNKWVSHCKKYASEHNCSYGEAMKKGRASYHPSQKGEGYIGDAIKVAKHFSNKHGVDSLRVAHDFITKNHGISRAIGYAGQKLAPTMFKPAVFAVSDFVKQQGYGKKGRK